MDGLDVQLLCIVCLCPVSLSCFVPGVEAGTHYKYEIKVKGGEVLLKADPYGNSADHDPEGASVVADVSAFQWNDGDWMKERSRFDDRKQPVSIYETSLEEWKSAEELVEFLAEEDFTLCGTPSCDGIPG